MVVRFIRTFAGREGDADVYFAFQERLEVMWAMKAYNHAEVYFNVSIAARTAGKRRWDLKTLKSF